MNRLSLAARSGRLVDAVAVALFVVLALWLELAVAALFAAGVLAAAALDFAFTAIPRGGLRPPARGERNAAVTAPRTSALRRWRVAPVSCHAPAARHCPSIQGEPRC